MDARLIRRLTSLWKRGSRSMVASRSDSFRFIVSTPGFALEPRIMLDAALVSTGAETLADADTLQNQGEQEPFPLTTQPGKNELAEALEAINSPATSKEVFLIDPSVSDYETLVAGIPDNAQIHILSSSASLEEIAGVLSSYQNLDAVHIISHGSNGSLFLSGEAVNSDSLELQQEVLQTIGQSLSEEGDILLYGCNVGSDGTGQAFVERLAELTEADIAASDDITGSEMLGGDWDLEISTGQVLQTPMAFSNYQGVLPTIGFDNFTPPAEDQPVTDYTEAGITLDITTTQTNYEFNKYSGETGVFDGSYIDLYHVNSGGDITITFDSDVDLTSIALGSAYQDFAMTLTPTGGVNSAVTTGIITGGPGDAIKVSLNWTDVSAFTITGATWGVYLDNFVVADNAPANNAPTISGAPSDITVTEDTASNVDLSTVTFADIDGDSLTVTLTASAGTMTATTGGGVTIGGSGTGTMTLAGTAGAINTYLDTDSNIKYTGASNANGDNAATLTIAAYDGNANLSINPVVNIDITAQNDAPSVTGEPSDITVTEDTASNVDLSDVTFADIDGDSLTVTLTASAGTMTATTGGGVTISDSGTGTITLAGTVAAINTYLDSASNIKYTGASNANGNDAATLTIAASDGNVDLSSNPVVNIDITAQNDAPSVTGAPSDITVTEDTPSNVDLSSVTFADIDGDSLTVTLTASAGTMIATSSGGVTISDSGTGTITLAGTVAAINTYLDTASNIKYTGASNVNGDNAATLTIAAYDGNADLSSNPVVNIDITAQNDAPEINGDPNNSSGDAAGFETTFTAGSTDGVAVADDDFSITDIDDTHIQSAVISLSAGVQDGTNESITIDGAPASSGGITITYTSNTQIDLSGSATQADYEALIKQIEYRNSTAAASATVGDRTISVTVNDDGPANASSNTESTTITVVAAPVVDTGNSGVTFTENNSNTPVSIIDDTATITDADSANLSQMVINISNGKTDDLISLEGRNDSDTVNGVTITYNSDTQITLTGTASKADYLALLKELQFVNSSDDPDTTTRTLSIASTDTDSNTGTVNTTITVQASDDAPVVSGDHTGSVNEGDAGDVETVSGTLGITDVDGNPSFADQTSTSGDNEYGSFVLSSGTWTYTLDQSAVQDLDAGDVVTDTITYTATDGTGQQITVTINGKDDSSEVSGTFTGSVMEGDEGDTRTATGALSISDVDGDDNPLFADQAATAGDNGYGSFDLSSGIWTYTLDQSAVQNLDAGDTVTDTITYTASDGTDQTITITITGSDDEALVGGVHVGNVVEGDEGDVVTVSGSLSISDVDDDHTPLFNDQAATAGGNGYGNFVLLNSLWTFTLDQSAVQHLNSDETVIDSITYTATDGSQKQITVTITGSDDISVVTGDVTGSVTEGNVGDSAVTATGRLMITNSSDNTVTFADQPLTAGDNGYGFFELNSGQWTYTLEQSAVQSFNTGDTVTDTITFVASDGTEQVVSVAIYGLNDNVIVQQPVEATPVEARVIIKAAAEPAIPDPVKISDGAILSSVVEGQPVEAPTSEVDAGAGSAAESVKSDSGLISTGSSNTKAFSVQGLFNQQGTINARYGASLMTGGQSSGAAVDNTAPSPVASLAESRLGSEFEAEQNEKLLPEENQQEEDDELELQPVDDQNPEPEAPEDAEKTEATLINATLFSDQLAIAVDEHKAGLIKLQNALFALSTKK